MIDRIFSAWERVRDRLAETQIWRSIYKTPRPVGRRARILTVMGSVVLHLHPTYIRRHSLKVNYTFCLGGTTFFLFMVETLTGVLLMFYYRPTNAMAYNDIKDLQFAVTLGMILRNMHRWGAHAMVLTVIFHMARVFYTGSYKPPREFNWVVGVLLLVLTLLLSFTGYLLPWDQLAFWAITVGTNMARATPFLGHEGPFHELLNMRPDNDVRFVLLGGTMVGESSLIRFYVLHCLALPLAVYILCAVHFWRIRKDGFSANL